MAAAQQILPLLTGPSNSKVPRPDLDERTTAAWLPNLYCVRNPLDVSLDSSGKSVLKVEPPPTCDPVRPLFLLLETFPHLHLICLGQVESVEKLFSILCSDTVDASLKRSAAEQLAVILQGNVLAGEMDTFSFKVACLLLVSLRMLLVCLAQMTLLLDL